MRRRCPSSSCPSQFYLKNPKRNRYLSQETEGEFCCSWTCTEVRNQRESAISGLPFLLLLEFPNPLPMTTPGGIHLPGRDSYSLLIKKAKGKQPLLSSLPCALQLQQNGILQPGAELAAPWKPPALIPSSFSGGGKIQRRSELVWLHKGQR